ncbi:hypothetical protein Nepgr_018552 [Nepenthes gracilis]|uniref:Uncharacterized protein n=1 Tax=Nepenthes gracilis TaxID=150966 RepID=A0AAD3XUF3_NEPGR|nr:hypothetical protein Nepgr_018552 [Nepenthes gracilis]
MGAGRHRFLVAYRREHGCIRLMKSSFSSTPSHDRTSLPTPNGQDNVDDTVRQISEFLKHSNWKLLLQSSDLSKKINPELVGSVLHQNRFSDPTRLLSFFYWWRHSTTGRVQVPPFSGFSINY